jgi:imidazolonepropionase-like amidohydrolase
MSGLKTSNRAARQLVPALGLHELGPAPVQVCQIGPAAGYAAPASHDAAPSRSRKAIREQIKNGVDHIKLNLSGGIMGPARDLYTHSFLLDDEIRAAFDICRKRGFKGMVYATNPDAVKNAIRLGAHSVEHGYIMDDECTPR